MFADGRLSSGSTVVGMPSWRPPVNQKSEIKTPHPTGVKGGRKSLLCKNTGYLPITTLNPGKPRGTKPKSTRMSSENKNVKPSQAVSISTASQITGTEVHTLRYWEREFAQFLQPERTEGGQRRYRPEDIQTVFTIKRLLRDEMFSIAGARRTLAKSKENAA
jgi:hypothetical protein